MKRLLNAVVLCSLAAIVVAGMVSVAYAEGVINWKVKISNPTDNNVYVSLYYDVSGKEVKEYTITKGASHTFETGAKCPSSLGGWVYGPQLSMADRCINGSAAFCTVICADSNWKITQHSDGAYHFDRD